jgi:hypothetical protein
MAGDMAALSVSFHSPQSKKGFIILTTQSTQIGDYGLGIRENTDRTQTTVTLSAPGVRHDYKYSMCTTLEKSDDRGYDFKENDEVKLKFRMYFFDCPDIPALFDYFIKIRKDLTGQVKLYNQIPFSHTWQIQETKYNKDNWHKEYEFYRVSPSDSIFGEWQTGQCHQVNM